MEQSKKTLITSVIALCIMLLTAIVATTGSQITSVAAEEGDYYVYLPSIHTIFRPPVKIIGHITENGSPAAGEAVVVLSTDGVRMGVAGSTTTDADGRYEFAGLDVLPSGYSYFVDWIDLGTGDDANRLASWRTPLVEGIGAGTTHRNATFDIGWPNANMQPGPNASVSLPHNFTWNPRSSSPTDSYEIFIIEREGQLSAPYLETGQLGYVGNYRLEQLPPGFEYGIQYYWYVKITSPDAGEGWHLEHPTKYIIFVQP